MAETDLRATAHDLLLQLGFCDDMGKREDILSAALAAVQQETKMECMKAMAPCAPKEPESDEPRSASARQFDLPANIPCWRCKTCGCCWRDNLDGTVSLWNAVAKPCALCEADTLTACAIYWIGVPGESITVTHARKQGAADGFQTGWHAALTRSDEATKELRALVPAPPGGLVDHLQGEKP